MNTLIIVISVSTFQAVNETDPLSFQEWRYNQETLMYRSRVDSFADSDRSTYSMEYYEANYRPNR